MTEISRSMSEYRELEKQLLALRDKTNGKYNPDEPAITDRMVDVWEELSTEEQDQIYAEGEKVPLPTDGRLCVRKRDAQFLSGWVISSTADWEVRFVSRPQVGMYFTEGVVSRGLVRWSDPISRDALNVREVEPCT